MRLIVKHGVPEYEMSFGPVTQICGCNMITKNYIIDSICKHFSSEKYKEYEQDMIDNIIIGEEVPGRKQWECYRIAGRKDIVSAIQLNKAGMLWKCIKNSVSNYNYQNELIKIDDILLAVFNDINKELLGNSNVEIQYCQEDILSIVQQSEVRIKDGRDIHELNTFDMLIDLLELIVSYQKSEPEKRMYVFENIDHYVENTQYDFVLKEAEKIAYETNTWFVFTTSLEGYVYISDASFENINIVNDDVFAISDYEHLVCYIRENYPVERNWKKEDIQNIIKGIVHKIGSSNGLLSIQKQVVLKIINDTYGIKDNWKTKPSILEINCLTG